MSDEYDTIKDYLVKLGFKIDPAQYANFNNILSASSNQVRKMTTSWETGFKVAAAGTVTAISSIMIGTAGLLDKVAKADLGYKLFAMRMLMDEGAAKKLKIATDALGYSMEEIIRYDELRERYKDLMKLQARLEDNMSGDFGKTMKGIRDIRFEFTKMKVEAIWGVQVLADTIAKKFGYELKDGESWLQRINEIIIRKTPEWAAVIADNLGKLQPLLDGVKVTAPHVADAIIAVFKAFSVNKDDMEWFVWEFGTVVNLLLTFTELTAAAGSPIQFMKKMFNEKDRADLARQVEGINKRANERADALRPQGLKEYMGYAGASSLVEPTKKGERYSGLIGKYFPAGAVSTATKVMMAESSGRPSAFNPEGGGYGALGLFQIRGKMHERALMDAGIISSYKDLLDPEKNVAAAAYLYKQSGWAPWESSRSRWEKPSVTVGDVHVHVATNANPQEIAMETARQIGQMTGPLQ